MSEDGQAVVWHGDALAVLATIAPNSIDAIVTDPPYELGFMGESWDNAGVSYSVDAWREALSGVVPGGRFLTLVAPRTHHRMMVAIEDAGFEIRDAIVCVGTRPRIS